MKRTIKISLDEALLPNDQEQIDKALLRLLKWGHERYPEVAIHNDGQNDMIAYYTTKREDGVAGHYAIGAVWRPDSNEYSFHS